MGGGAWWAAVHGATKNRTRLSDFTFTFHYHALEKEMATHSSVLAWRIPATGEPGGLPSMGSHRVGHDWSDLAAAAAAAKTFFIICLHLFLQAFKLKMQLLLLTGHGCGPEPGSPAHFPPRTVVRAWDAARWVPWPPASCQADNLAPLQSPAIAFMNICWLLSMCVSVPALTLYLLTKERRFPLIIGTWASLHQSVAW